VRERTITVVLFVICAATVIAQVSERASPSRDRDGLVGAWRVVEVRREGAGAFGGSFRQATGWRGVVLFTPDGYYSINVTNTERRRSDEYAFMETDEAEAGTYRDGARAGAILVKPMIARLETDIGATDVFFVRLDRETATITTVRRQRESHTEIRLMRVK
jgi:hypothetical protein